MLKFIAFGPTVNARFPYVQFWRKELSYLGAEQRKAILCGGLGYNFVMSQPVHGAVTAVAFLLKSINLSTLV